MRIKGDNLSKALHVVPGTWWEHNEFSFLILWLFFLLTSAYTESWLAAVGIHLTGLIGCGSRKVLPLKARPEQNRNLPRLTQRLVSLTWHSPWGRSVLRCSQNSFLGALAVTGFGRECSPGDVVWSRMSFPHLCQHTQLLVCSPAISPVTQSSIYCLSMENSCLLLLTAMTSLQTLTLSIRLIVLIYSKANCTICTWSIRTSGIPQTSIVLTNAFIIQ